MLNDVYVCVQLEMQPYDTAKEKMLVLARAVSMHLSVLSDVYVCVQLEMQLYDTAKEKMMVLARAVSERRDSSAHETKFVQDAITQLLKARHVLKCSYVYGYYLEEVGYKKPIFEFMQVSGSLCLCFVHHVVDVTD